VVAAEPKRILEVGCGWGDLAEWVVRETGAELVAVDLSPHMVELARERRVEARVGDVQALPFEDGAFDVAIAAWMLYHVPDLDRGIAELARVLRPGGRLVVATNSRRRHFAQVAREDIDGRLEFADRAEVEEYVHASISMSPFVANLPAEVDEPFFARRATSIFVAEKVG
jgi:ubiquinone/menaquinone biosynthesis C-methylase UbiE